MNPPSNSVRRTALRLCSALFALAPAAGLSAQEAAAKPAAPAAAKTQSLEEMRLMMGKWIETQQLLAKERNEWQQGKELLVTRLDLVKKEIALLETRIVEAKTNAEKAKTQKAELLAENESLKADNAMLAEAVAPLEVEIKKLVPSLPEPIAANTQKLLQRIPTDAATTRSSPAERLQNVLGILDIANKANTEITLNFEVRTLPSGKRAEVQAIYVGLGQAYYVTIDGDAGVGRPTPTGWEWEPAPTLGKNLLLALDIMKGKHSATYPPLPVVLQ
jgi:hypothetical protein